jgi:hypothetical protein
VLKAGSAVTAELPLYKGDSYIVAIIWVDFVFMLLLLPTDQIGVVQSSKPYRAMTGYPFYSLARG